MGRSPVSRAIRERLRDGATDGVGTFDGRPPRQACRMARSPTSEHAMPSVTSPDGSRRPRSRSSATSPREAGLHRVSILAWRDLDDPEAGGSEVHASNVAQLWAEAGHRGHDAHVVRGRAPAGELARRLPRDPQGRPLPRVPACRVQRDDGLARRARRPGRDLERHAVLLAAVVAHRARHLAAPRARRDVEDDAAAAPRARSATSSSRRSRRRSTAARRSSPCRSRASTSWCTTSASRPIVSPSSPPGIDPRFTPGGEKSPTPLVVAVGRLVPVKQFDVLVDALVRAEGDAPRARSGDRGRGLPARGARGPDPRRAAPRRGSPCPAASTTTTRSTCTAAPGCSRAPPPARAGG